MTHPYPSPPGGRTHVARGFRTPALINSRPEGGRVTRTRQQRSALALLSIVALAPHALAQNADNQTPLSISFWAQARYTATYRADPDDTAESLTHGFSLRRTRLSADANIGEIALTMTASFARNSASADVSDAYIEAPLSDTVGLRLGQFKAPLLKEELTSAKRLLTADRSNVNGIFTLSRVQGIALDAEQDRNRFTVMLHDGADGANTDFNDSVADFAIAARNELLLWGDFSPFRAATSERGTSPSAMLGGAIDYEALNDAAFDNMLTGTVDLDFKNDGWGAMVAGIVRHQWGDQDQTDFGLVAQASVYVGERDELFARADVVFADSDLPESDPFPGFTIGMNHYIIGHALKVTADLTYFPVSTEDNDLISANTGIGLLDSDGSDAQFVGRLQLQAVF